MGEQSSVAAAAVLATGWFPEGNFCGRGIEPTAGYSDPADPHHRPIACLLRLGETSYHFLVTFR